MWKAIKVYGINYSWCVQNGVLRVYDEEDTVNTHENRFYSLYKYVDKLDAFARVHVREDLTQRQAYNFILRALHTDTNCALL